MEESNQKCDLAGDRGTTAAVIWPQCVLNLIFPTS